MLIRVAVACFALYCVHGAQNSARDTAALAQQGGAMVREASAQAPRAAMQFCLENAALCARAANAATGAAPASTLVAAHALPTPIEGVPLPPRRPAAHKKA